MFGKPNQKRGDRETPNSFTAYAEPVTWRLEPARTEGTRTEAARTERAGCRREKAQVNDMQAS